MVKLEKLIQEISKIDTITKEKEIQTIIVEGKQLIPEIYSYVKSNGKYKKEAKTALKQLSAYLGFSKYKDMENSLKDNKFLSIEADKFRRFCLNIVNLVEDLYYDRNKSSDLEIFEIKSVGYVFKYKEATFYLARNEIINFFSEFLRSKIRSHEKYILIYLIKKDEKLQHESIKLIPDLINVYKIIKDKGYFHKEMVKFIVSMGKDVVTKLMDVYVSYKDDWKLHHRNYVVNILIDIVHEYKGELKKKASRILLKDITEDDFRTSDPVPYFFRLNIAKVLLTINEFSNEVINYVLKIIDENKKHQRFVGSGENLQAVIKATEVLRKFIKKVDRKIAIPILTKYLISNRYGYAGKFNSDNRVILFNIVDILILLGWEDETVIEAFFLVWLNLINEKTKGEQLKKQFELKLFKIAVDNVKAYEIISTLTTQNREKGWWPTFVRILMYGRGRSDLSTLELIGKLKQQIKIGDKQVKNKNIEEGLKSFEKAFETSRRVISAFGKNILNDEKEHIKKTIYKILYEKYSSLIKESKKSFSIEDFEHADEIMKKAQIISKHINYYCKDMKFVEDKDAKELEGKISEIKNKDQIQKAVNEKKKQEDITPLIKKGNAHLTQHEYEEAQKTFEKALTIYPGYEKALQGMNSASKMIIASQKIVVLLQKFQPNLPVALTRIAELSSLKNNEAEIIIKAFLAQNKTLGKYFDLEQVFVKSEGIDQELSSIAERYEKLKHYTCFTCGNPLDKDVKTCSECKKEVPFCNVCKLPITFGDEIGKCSLCESVGHMNHLQEWIKTQGKCPTCLQNLPIEGIVPLSETKKK